MPDCRTAPQHIKPYSLASTSHSVVFPIHPGVVGLVASVADGSTKSETTTARHLPTSGDRPLDAVIVDERRDGPRWLCDGDDDDIYCLLQEASQEDAALSDDDEPTESGCTLFVKNLNFDTNEDALKQVGG